MKSPIQLLSEEVAVRHLATSAQPPRATFPFDVWSSSQPAPHPFPSSSALDTPGALLEGLRCFPAAFPLPGTFEGHRKNIMSCLGDSE
jgi:hypothetical protein